MLSVWASHLSLAVGHKAVGIPLPLPRAPLCRRGAQCVLNLCQKGLSVHKGAWCHRVFALCHAPTAAVQPSLNIHEPLQREKFLGNWALLILLLFFFFFCYKRKSFTVVSQAPWLSPLGGGSLLVLGGFCSGLQAGLTPPAISQPGRKHSGGENTSLCVRYLAAEQSAMQMNISLTIWRRERTPD